MISGVIKILDMKDIKELAKKRVRLWMEEQPSVERWHWEWHD